MIRDFVFERPRLVLAAWALFFALSICVLVRGGDFSSGDIAGLPARIADRVAAELESAPNDNTVVVIMSSKTEDPRDASFRAERDRALAKIRNDPRIANIATASDANPLVRPRLQNGAAKTEIALVTLAGTYAEAKRAYPEIREKISSNALDITCTGRIPYMHDLDHTLEKDLLFAEAISLPLAILVLLFVFRTVVSALIPVLSGALCVVIAIAILTALSRVMDVASYAVNVTSLIGLGVAIDYCLFLVSRYREELAAGKNTREAVAIAVRTAGRAAAFSGLAVGVGLAGLFFFRHSYLETMGLGGAIVVFLSVASALTFVPALLLVLGPRIHRLSIRKRRAVDTTRWRTLAHAVMKRPFVVLVPTVLVLLFAARPFTRIAVSAADVRVLDESTEARHGLTLLARDFPEQASTRIVVALEFPNAPALNAERIIALYKLSRNAHKIPGVVKVESIVSRGDDTDDEDASDAIDPAAIDAILHPSPLAAPVIESAKKLLVGDHIAVLYVETRAPPDSEIARNIVRTLRASPDVADGHVLVGGTTAVDLDTIAFMQAHAPAAIAFVVIVTIVVLFLQLRSVILPLKAVVMNLLSIGASFGALVYFFQEGHVLVREGRPLEPTLPVLLFCVIFGLSMDYEVLILARIREEWDRTHDNTAAIAFGLEKTAGLVTSAAMIMVLVFAAFAIARVVLLQAVGVGMAIAVAVDATLVRVLLVPATMRLFGKWNWWTPFARDPRRDL